MLTNHGRRMAGGDGGDVRYHHHHRHHLLLQQRQQLQHDQRQPSPRGAARRQRRSVAGEVVEVQGGHIVRAAGRKDRHSKVCTSKGPRDRRVRLSAHTAIQFYDVQDRLGYDRPSKAVDWLIQHAKSAIDQLAHLPPWRPPHQPQMEPTTHHQQEVNNAPITHHHDIVPPSLESDAIADTINLFFPVVSQTSSTSLSTHSNNTNTNTNTINNSIISYPQQDLLRLSLESFRKPSSSTIERPPLFSHGWAEQNPSHVVHWVPPGGVGGSSGYGFPVTEQMVGEGPLMTQRCPLQSNGSSSSSQFIYPFGHNGFAGFHAPARIHGEDEHPPPPPSLHLLVAADIEKRKE